MGELQFHDDDVWEANPVYAERDRLRTELEYIHTIASRFMSRGHCGFEYDEISEGLAVALQELSLIRRRSVSALQQEDSR